MAEARTAKEIEAAERKAMAEAEAAERDLAKKQVETDTLQLDLERKRAELDEWKAGSRQREAEASANAQALQLKNDESQRAAIQAMIPDLSTVERGSTTVPEASTVFQALLGGRALQDAASKLVPVVKGDAGLGDDYKVLVTTDLELAARDASYLSVIAQLHELQGLVDQFRARQEPVRGLGAATSIAVAAARLLPGLLSLISAKRTITATNTTVDDDTAMMAVAGALAGADSEGTVVVEKTRILSVEGAAHKSWTELQMACQRLSDDLDAEGGKEGHDADRIAEGKSLLKTCQTALLAMTTVAEGASMSALAKAALQDALHSDEFQGVLVVKGSAASSTQLVDDRPLRFGDPLSVVSTATISYLLIDHRNGSRVLRGGLAHGTAQMTGEIGSTLSLP